jgi:hypothetical protein
VGLSCLSKLRLASQPRASFSDRQAKVAHHSADLSAEAQRAKVEGATVGLSRLSEFRLASQPRASFRDRQAKVAETAALHLPISLRNCQYFIGLPASVFVFPRGPRFPWRCGQTQMRRLCASWPCRSRSLLHWHHIRSGRPPIGP